MSDNPPHVLSDKIIGIVLLNQKGRYLPRVARVINSAEDKDAFLHIIGQQPSTASLEEALALFDGDGSKGIDIVYRKPVRTSITGFTWASEILAAQEV